MHGTSVSTVNAFTAHREWATRPPDERFNSVQALYEAARTRRIGTEERDIETVDFGTEAVAEDVIALRDPSGRPVDRACDHIASLCTRPSRRAGQPGARPHGFAPRVAVAARLQGRRLGR